MSKQYDDSNGIVLFKNDSDNEKAPHWTGKVKLSKEILASMPDDFELRVAVWKKYPKNADGGQFFLAGKVELPMQGEGAPKKKVVDEDDDWG